MASISNIVAHRILDSNGQWTIEAVVMLDDGTRTTSAVPSGHLVGKHEAKLVAPEKAIESINNQISPTLRGTDPSDQDSIDNTLIKLDQTGDKSRLGANTMLAVSLACFKAAALTQKIEPFQYINEIYQFKKPTLEEFPTPLINLINGGAHASNNLEFQSFMVSPATYISYSKSLEQGVQVYHKLKEILVYKNLKIDVGEEGGFAPSGLDTEQACHYVVQAILESGIKAGTDMFLAIDVAASTFYDAPNYQTRGVIGTISPNQLREVYINLVRNFPILYLEDPFAEDSWEDWSTLRSNIGGSVEIISDDLTVSNQERLKNAVKKSCITGVIIKTNQIGTITETIDLIRQAQKENLTIVISHRGGETAEDSFIADLAVGVGANYIKAGAPARGERTIKYNRLLEIENILMQNNPVPVAVNLDITQKGKIMDNTETPVITQTSTPVVDPLAATPATVATPPTVVIPEVEPSPAIPLTPDAAVNPVVTEVVEPITANPVITQAAPAAATPTPAVEPVIMPTIQETPPIAVAPITPDQVVVPQPPA